jgi:hypothetical protein
MADQPQHPAILASDEDRNRSIELLSTSVAEGRMTLEEFSDRVGLAQEARTQDDLAVLARDLPAVVPEPGLVPAHARWGAAQSPSAVAPRRRQALTGPAGLRHLA